jgi:hypothetical protein
VFDDAVCRTWLSCGVCSSKSLTKEQASKDAIARAEKHAKDMAQLRSGKLQEPTLANFFLAFSAGKCLCSVDLWLIPACPAV